MMHFLNLDAHESTFLAALEKLENLVTVRISYLLKTTIYVI